MLQIRCTAKVLDALGAKASDTCEIVEPDTLLGHWYANLFNVDRRKSIILMNEKTLLSFMLFGVKKGNIQRLPEMFIRGLVQTLDYLQFGAEAIERLLGGYEVVELTKTNNRRLLGNLTDLMHQYTHCINYDGGLKYCDLGEIVISVNNMPQRNLGWDFSVDAVRELLENEGKDA